MERSDRKGTRRDGARSLADAGADLVGANCGTGVDAMIDVARAFAVHATVPIAVRPNAGLPQRQGDRLVYAEAHEQFAAAAATLLAHRVKIIGGCCGTMPAHIRALAAAVATRRPVEVRLTADSATRSLRLASASPRTTWRS